MKPFRPLQSIVFIAGFVWGVSQLLSAQVPVVPAGSIKVIFDTDFVVPPQDDGTALILALHSPGVEGAWRALRRWQAIDT